MKTFKFLHPYNPIHPQINIINFHQKELREIPLKIILLMEQRKKKKSLDKKVEERAVC